MSQINDLRESGRRLGKSSQTDGILALGAQRASDVQNQRSERVWPQARAGHPEWWDPRPEGTPWGTHGVERRIKSKTDRNPK